MSVSTPLAPVKGAGSQTRISCDPRVVSVSVSSSLSLCYSDSFNESHFPESLDRILAKRVVCGLDTLKLSLWVDWEGSALLERLHAVKSAAQDQDVPSLPVDLAGYEFNVMRAGTMHFAYRLVRGDLRILINRRKATGPMPTCRVEIGSVSCWSPGYREIYAQVRKVIELYGGVVVKERVSEVHLCADTVGESIHDLPVANQDYWVSRAYTFSTHYSRRALTGVTIGKGDLSLRVYDKILEIQNQSHKQEIFLQVWRLDSLDSCPVTRTEFHVRRPILREFEPKINTFDDLLNSLSSVWEYCTREWARLCSGEVDRKNKNQWHSKPHLFWRRLIKESSFSGTGVVVRRKRYVLADLERLARQGLGFFLTIAASQGFTDDPFLIRDSIIDAIEETYSDFVLSDDFFDTMKRKFNAVVQAFAEPGEEAHGIPA